MLSECKDPGRMKPRRLVIATSLTLLIAVLLVLARVLLLAESSVGPLEFKVASITWLPPEDDTNPKDAARHETIEFEVRNTSTHPVLILDTQLTSSAVPGVVLEDWENTYWVDRYLAPGASLRLTLQAIDRSGRSWGYWKPLMDYKWQYTGPAERLPASSRFRAWYNRKCIELKRQSHIALPYASDIHRSRSRDIAMPSVNGRE